MKTYTEMLPHIEGKDYETHFWNAIRGKQGQRECLVNGIDSDTGALTLTPKGQDKYMAAIKQDVVVKHFCNSCGKKISDCFLEAIRDYRFCKGCFAPLYGFALDRISNL